MNKKIKYICIGHKPPDFRPPIDYIMLCPNTMGLPNEMVVRDDRFGMNFDGASLAEYSQLFGLAEMIKAGEIHADSLFLFQYRKFLSPLNGGFQSVAPWVKIISPNMAGKLFPNPDDLNNLKNDLIVGSMLDFTESISNNYSRTHVAEDLVTFSAACAMSEVVTPDDISLLARMRGIIPSPALCHISIDLFLNFIGILEKVCVVFMKNFHTKRDGYQSRSAGYLLERLHSILICKCVLNGDLDKALIWNRYVVNPNIN